MIAALVLLALAASAQVQAFPGSDPTEALAVFPEEPELLGLNVADNVLCLIGFYSKIQDLVANSKKEIQPIEDAVNTLVSNIKECGADKGPYNKFTCGLQAIRDSWENSAEVRTVAEDLAKKAIALAKEIKEKCFQSTSLLHKQTLPRQIVY